MRFLQATPEQQAAIERILDGKAERAPGPPKGPLLMMIKDAAVLLGVHRATIWRLLRAGRLEPVVLLGAVRVRRADVEGIAAGHRPADAGNPRPEGRSPKANREVAR
jgi:excisionase family DNA binding protein